MCLVLASVAVAICIELTFLMGRKVHYEHLPLKELPKLYIIH